MAKHQRSFKNFLVDANFQIKYALYFAASGVAVMGVLFALISLRLNQMVQEVVSTNLADSGLEKSFSHLLYDITLFTLITFIANTVFSFLFAIYMTHRISGPAMVIERYIKDLSSGNYDSNRTLRKSDDLQSVMAALRELAANLKSKQR
ncbi:MAG: hypothetical protein AB7N80_06185 [Bdellovibrionales bacterium]